MLCGLCACGDNGDSAPASDPASNPSNAQTEDGGNSESNTEQPASNPEELTAFERLFSNGALAAQDTSELWGYIDSTGAWVISPTFAEARNFWSSGLALAKDVDSQLWGLADTSGNFVIEPTFDDIGNSLDDNLFRVHVSNRGWGYIDETGAFAIEPQFDEAKDFSGGFAIVSSHSVNDPHYYRLWGYINTSGERITEDIFSEAQPFSDGLALVKDVNSIDGFYGYIDEFGSFAVQPMYTRATPFYYGRACVDIYVMGDPNTYYCLIDKEGKLLTGPVSSKLVQPYFWSGVCPVPTPDGTGYVYIDEAGNTVLPKSGEVYAGAGSFSSDGLAVAVDAETMQSGYIDLDGNWVIPPQYTQAGGFNNGLAFVTIDQNQTAVIDTSGNRLLNLDGKAIVNPRSFRTPERILVNMFNSDGTMNYVNPHYYSVNEGPVIDYNFDAADDFAADYSYAKVQYEGLWGFIDKDGNWLIPAQFLAISSD